MLLLSGISNFDLLRPGLVRTVMNVINSNASALLGVKYIAGEQHVRLVVDVPLPHLVREELLSKGAKMLSRHSKRFGSASLHVHVKPSGSAVECGVNLFTDDGSFHASVEEWNVLHGVDAVLEMVHLQIVKRASRRVVIKA